MSGQANKNAFTLSSNIPSVIKELQMVQLRLNSISKDRDITCAAYLVCGFTLDVAWQGPLLSDFLINSLGIRSKLLQ